MRVPETRAARWCRSCARGTTARRSRPRRGCWRNILQRIVVLRSRVNLRMRRIAVSRIIRPQSAYGEYFSSSGLFSRLRGPGEEPQAADEVAVEAGGSDRCWVGWVAGGEAAASVEAAAEAVGLPGVGRV